MSGVLNTNHRGGRPTILARRGVVSSGHYLASEIGVSILRRGGNAADAAAAMAFALTLLKPHQNGIAGEAPTLIYIAAESKVHAVNGHGPAPAAATLDYFRSLGVDRIPGDGFLPAIVPPAVATWILVLSRFGTMRLADVLAPAVELARDGFAIYDSLAKTVAGVAERFIREWPTSAAVFLPAGRAPEPGELFTNRDWADTFQSLLDAEAKHRDRLAGLAAAADVFYRGPIARRICQFAATTPIKDASGQAHTGLLTVDDFASYEAAVEAPVSTSYRDWRVFKCGPWTQGPAMLETLNLLEGFDVAAMGHNSPDYVHTVVELMKLAYADREFYYGDPAAGDVGLAHLLSKSYAAERRKLIGPIASKELRPGRLPGRRACDPFVARSVIDIEQAWSRFTGDTTKLEAIDAAGNAVSSTVSGGWLHSSPVIPGLGFPLGTRGQMFSLEAGHPNCIAPGKRPRSTLTPGIAIRVADDALAYGSRLNDPKSVLAFGSPGGDAQDQWAVQFFLNFVHFGMSLQQAIEAPTFWSEHWPISFYPRTCRPGVLLVEGRIAQEVRDELARRGHQVIVSGDWSGGNTLAAMHEPAKGLLSAAASPRLDPSYALGF